MADQKLRVDITAKDRSRQAFSRVQKSLGRLKNSLLSVKGLIGAAFGALAVRALVKFVTNTVKASDAIVKTADAIGLSTDKLQELRFAADLSGISVDKMDKALLGFSKRVGEARAGTGSLVTLLDAVDSNLLKNVQSAQTVDEAFALIIKAARSMGNEMDQSALLAAAFGAKAGVALKNLLPDMEALMAEARRLGVVIDEDLLRGAAEMNDEFTRLGAVISTQLTQAVLANKEQIIELTRAFIQAIPQIALAVKNFAMWVGLLERPLDIQLSNARMELQEFTKALKTLDDGNWLQDIATEIPLAFEALRNFEFEGDFSKTTEEWLGEKIKRLQEQIRFLEAEQRKRERALTEADAPIERAVTIMDSPAAAAEINRYEKLQELVTERIAGLHLEQSTLGRSETAIAKLTLAEQLNAAVRRDAIDLTEPQIAALTDLVDQYGVLHESIEAEKAAMEEATRVAEENQEQVDALANTIRSSLIESLADLATGFTSWRDVAKSALRDVIRAMLNFISVQSGMGGGSGGGGLISNLLGAGLNALSGSMTTTPSAPVRPAPPINTSGPIMTAAKGGALQANQLSLVGEVGPELFVPKSAGNIIPNGEFGGGGVTVNQTINLSTGVQATVRAEVMGLLPQIAASTKSAVLSARVRGGSFADAFGA